ncbi:MAG: TolC family protein [Paracoccaceae bacterium]
MRVKSLRILATAALTSALALGAAGALAESLSDAMVSAYRSSGLLAQQRALLRAEDEDVAAAVAGLRPVINYAVQAGVNNNTTSWSGRRVDRVTETLASAAALAVDGRHRVQLRDQHAPVDLARENVLMTRDALVRVEQDVLLRAVSAFLDVRSAHEAAMLQANNVRLITEELRAARGQFEVGEIHPDRRLLCRGATTRRRPQQRGCGWAGDGRPRGMQGRHRPLSNGLQVPPAAPITVRTLADAKAMARTHHPDVLAQQRAVKISDMAVEIAHRSMLPSLTAGGSASRSLSRTHVAASDTTSIGVDMTLSGPIYQGGQLSAQYRKAKAQSEANRAALYVTVQNVEQAVANAWAQLAVAQASLQASEQQIRASTVALRGAREEATLGARTTLEVLSFEQDLLDAQAARISAQSTQYLAIYSLISAMGLLTADDLRLGIATYDPEAYYNAVKGAPVYDISPQGARLDAIIETLGRKLD